MKAYVDASVILRVVFGERDRLPDWGRIDVAVSSELVRLECLRTIDRARLRLRLDDTQVARSRADAQELIDALVLVALDRTILDRAASPFPTTLGSLDAIHLASALAAREQIDGLRFATHDAELATGAIATGFDVDGVSIMRGALHER